MSWHELPPSPELPSWRDRRNVGGLALIGVGIYVLLAQFVPLLGEIFLLGVGLVLLALYATRRGPYLFSSGFLIGGCILTGLGAGILIAARGPVPDRIDGAVIMAGLALGFVAVWLVERTSRWPLYPAAACGAIAALSAFAAIENLPQADSRVVFPVSLIALGIWLVLRRQRRRG